MQVDPKNPNILAIKPKFQALGGYSQLSTVSIQKFDGFFRFSVQLSYKSENTSYTITQQHYFKKKISAFKKKINATQL